MYLSLSNFSVPRRVPLAAVAATAVSAFVAAPAMASTAYVSPKGHDTGSCSQNKPCKSIAFAVSKSHPGGKVQVAKGTYRGTVNLGRKLKLVGVGHPVLNARGFANGILITGAKAAGATVQGFTVENALNEGILALQTARVTIAGNLVKDNNKGVLAKKPTGECAAQGQVPGDCGEGVHLMTVSHATVTGNTVEDNLGGILVSDEFGPTADNVISGNTVLNNAFDCGITIVSHNITGFVGGKLQPSKGGVYGNVIVGNTANDNGLKGQGGGILIAAGPPGSAVYNNTVKGNTANGNGLGGFTLHSHAPGQYFNGNKITGNTFLHDGLAGNAGGKPGDVDAGITRSVGIIVFSAVTPLVGTVISGNHLGNEYYGIWTEHVPTIKKSANTFAKSVTVDVFQK
jgi:parallel beta-helix repeat protein